MAQVIDVTSEPLQATVRRLVPSQAGFSEDLQASNVIQPIIDLTPTAEGSQLPQELRTAISFTDLNPFNVSNGNATLASTPGFYEVYCTTTIENDGTTSATAQFSFLNGASTKNLFIMGGMNDSSGINYIRFICFLDTNDLLLAISSSADALMTGSVRQIADRYGNLLNPTGFTFE